MGKETNFNSKEKEIIIYLHKKGGMVTPHKISKDTGISYVTVMKYLKKLSEKRIVLPVYYTLKLSKVKSIDGAIKSAERSNKVTKERKKRGNSVRYQLNPLMYLPSKSKKQKKQDN